MRYSSLCKVPTYTSTLQCSLLGYCSGLRYTVRPCALFIARSPNYLPTYDYYYRPYLPFKFPTPLLSQPPGLYYPTASSLRSQLPVSKVKRHQKRLTITTYLPSLQQLTPFSLFISISTSVFIPFTH
jgi:hypothetical protein